MNKKQTFITAIVVVVVFLLTADSALSYHIFRTQNKTSYISWATPTNLTFVVDPDDGSGDIRITLDLDLDSAVNTWSAPATTSLDLSWQKDNILDDIACPIIDCDDFIQILNNLGTRNVETEPVILWDDTGNMLLTLDDRLDPNRVLGLGVPMQLFDIEPNNPIIKDGFLILNLFYNWDGVGAADRRATLTHELGHLLGIGHSNIAYYAIGGWFSGEEPNLPTMYPFAYQINDADADSLAHDDIAAISTLYPTILHSTANGLITGIVTINDNQTQRECISVAAIDNFSSNVYSRAYVGRLTGTSELGSSVGEYVIEGVPPGDYYLMFQPFTGSSSINSQTGDSGISIQHNIDPNCPDDCTFPIQWGSVDQGGAPIIGTDETQASNNAFSVDAGKVVTLPTLNLSNVTCPGGGDDDGGDSGLEEFFPYAPVMQAGGGGGCSLVNSHIGPEALILFLILFGPVVILKVVSIIRRRLI